MTETERLGLTQVNAVNVVRENAAHDFEKFVLALFFEFAFEFRVGVEMVFNCTLVAARDEDHLRDARAGGFFHGVLNQGFVDDRKHFLGHRLRGGKKTRAEAVDGEYDFANGFHGAV